MGLRIPPLKINIMLESNPLKSTMLVRGLAVAALAVAVLVAAVVSATVLVFVGWSNYHSNDLHLKMSPEQKNMQLRSR